MKISTSRTTTLLAICLTALVPTLADARPRRPIPGGGGPGGGGAGIAPAPRFDLKRGLGPELRAEREKFHVWRQEVRGGHRYFADSEKDIRQAYAGLNLGIAKHLINDQISDKLGAVLLAKTEAVGEKSLANFGRGELTDEQATKVKAALRDIHAELKEKSIERPDPAIRTPDLNKFQLEAAEVIRFGEESGTLSAGKASSLNRKLAKLESKEQSAKSGGELSDRDRENLFEEARELAKDLLDEFHG